MRTIPSFILNISSDRKYSASPDTIRTMGISLLTVVDETKRGLNKAVIPNTNAMLVIFDPIAFPIAVFGFPANEAVAETTISGADDPIATMVKPITIGDTPIFFANADAP
jgi:hypothetical protein